MKDETFCHKDGFICHPKNNKYCRGCKVIRKKQLLTLAAILFFAAMAIAISMALSGCQPPATVINTITDKDKAINACIAAGGVPKYSKFNGAFDDCIWRPGVKP